VALKSPITTTLLAYAQVRSLADVFLGAGATAELVPLLPTPA